MDRRDFLKATLVGGSSAALFSALNASRSLVPGLVIPAEAAVETPRKLRIISRTLEINKRAANVFGLVDAEGRPGLTYREGEAFRVSLTNELREPTLIHWHGLRPPYEQDGVPNMPTPMLEGGNTREYDFPVGAAGTHWMHAHTLQEQNLLAAPLVVRDREEAGRDEQEVVVLLHDFSFTPAEELLARLKRSTGGHSMHGGMGAMDLNDIDYDAYLANDRTLDDPEIVNVETGGRVRLRIINGATATVFSIDAGEVEAALIAVDGKDVEPCAAAAFPSRWDSASIFACSCRRMPSRIRSWLCEKAPLSARVSFSHLRALVSRDLQASGPGGLRPWDSIWKRASRRGHRWLRALPIAPSR